MPQLDALRALAVLAVALHHSSLGEKLPWGLTKIPWGTGGVHLFFVLSGFLITGILLRCRDFAHERGSRWIAIRQFYIRRFLRICPLYYLVVLAALLANLNPAREVAPWLLTYTINVYMAKVGYFIDNFAHFWSLAVEEHFYLVWPWLVLFLPRKWLIGTAISFVCLSPVFRIYAYQNLSGVSGYILTPGNLDTLSMGSLLAIATYQTTYPRAVVDRWLVRLALPLGLILTVLFAGWSARIDWRVSIGLGDFAMALIFCWLVAAASRGFRGVAGAVLQTRPLLYLGKISYGIYVYHELTPISCLPVPVDWVSRRFPRGRCALLSPLPAPWWRHPCRGT
jgi:peptidoglycan/LPS O-acetylase OafA/YrhL